jgi:hypothetical protein
MYIRRPHITITARRAAVATTAALGITAGLLLSGVGQAKDLKEGPAHMEDFAWASQPQWNFHKGENCWPTKALDDDGYPNQGIECSESSDAGEDGEAFPTYYTAKKCNPDEVRVSYTIYQPKDGEDDEDDFEHIIVKWKKNGDNWSRDELLLSDDGEYSSVAWGEAESWNEDGDKAGKGLDFPRIFVYETRHGMHNGDDDASHEDNLGHDYPVPASKNYDGDDKDDKEEGTGLVEVNPDNGESKALYNKFKDNMDAFPDEDDQMSNPANVADKLCEASA